MSRRGGAAPARALAAGMTSVLRRRPRQAGRRPRRRLVSSRSGRSSRAGSTGRRLLRPRPGVSLRGALLGSVGDVRRARHLVGFALVPLAASFSSSFPLRLALYGVDFFRGGAVDEGTGDGRPFAPGSRSSRGRSGSSCIGLRDGVAAGDGRGHSSRYSGRSRSWRDPLRVPDDLRPRPRTGRARPRAWRTCAAPRGSGARARRRRTRRVAL